MNTESRVTQLEDELKELKAYFALSMEWCVKSMSNERLLDAKVALLEVQVADLEKQLDKRNSPVTTEAPKPRLKKFTGGMD